MTVEMNQIIKDVAEEGRPARGGGPPGEGHEPAAAPKGSRPGSPEPTERRPHML